MAGSRRKPKSKPKLPTCPEHLDDVAKGEWKRVTELLKDAQILTEIDRGVLAAYCRAWSLYVEADKKVQKFGSMLISKRTGAPYQSPYVNQMTAAMKDLARFGAELGFTPLARKRMGTGPPLAASDTPDASTPSTSSPFGKLRMVQ